MHWCCMNPAEKGAEVIVASQPGLSELAESHCGDAKLIGTWRTEYGSYHISQSDACASLVYVEEDSSGDAPRLLTGTLDREGEWWQGDIVANGTVIGQLRIQPERDGLRSFFKPTGGEWCQMGLLSERVC
mmetsp:Transcript_90116/g.259823  ORF Transcript_90116/g.259823 Transcript_90116/m.259823 type:complete len:130 (-) Transcript_90116:220-609(-)